MIPMIPEFANSDEIQGANQSLPSAVVDAVLQVYNECDQRHNSNSTPRRWKSCIDVATIRSVDLDEGSPWSNNFFEFKRILLKKWFLFFFSRVNFHPKSLSHRLFRRTNEKTFQRMTMDSISKHIHPVEASNRSLEIEMWIVAFLFDRVGMKNVRGRFVLDKRKASSEQWRRVHNRSVNEIARPIPYVVDVVVHLIIYNVNVVPPVVSLQLRHANINGVKRLVAERPPVPVVCAIWRSSFVDSATVFVKELSLNHVKHNDKTLEQQQQQLPQLRRNKWRDRWLFCCSPYGPTT